MNLHLGRRLLEFVRATIVGGLLVLVPIVVLAAFVGYAIEVAWAALAPVFARLPFQSATSAGLAAVTGVAVVILLCFLAGLVAETALIRWAVRSIESRILAFLPGYSLMKGVGTSFVGVDGTEGRRPVLVRFHDTSQIGFEMERLVDGRAVVFIPTAPNPLTGAIHILDADRITPLPATIGPTFECISRLGIDASRILTPAAAITKAMAPAPTTSSTGIPQFDRDAETGR